MFLTEVSQRATRVICAKASSDNICKVLTDTDQFDKRSFYTTRLKIIAKLKREDIDARLQACSKDAIDSRNLLGFVFIKEVICRACPDALTDVEHRFVTRIESYAYT